MDSQTKTTFFITGGAGFIGSNLADRLLAAGNRVVVYDDLSTGQREFIEEASRHPDFELVEGDILDRDTLARSIEGADVVFHLAANADIRGGLDDPGRDLEQNTIGTFNVLEAMREKGVARIAFASSAAALGEPRVFPTPEDCAVPVQTSLYGASKMAGEGLIAAYCEGYGFEGYVFRFVSLLGERYPHGHVIDFVKALRANPNTLRILGDGTQQKSYLHVSDCIDAMLNVIEKKTALDAKHNVEIYNLGYPEYITVATSVKWICQRLELEPRLDYQGGERGWVGDNPFVFLDVSKMKQTGWEPKFTIRESIIATVDWLVANPWLLERR